MLAKGERTAHVIATVVGCSDSRVPPEFVFNSDPGDLFVVRTAGASCLSDESLASVDFGILHLKSPLLVVLGHTDCKAIKTSLQTTGADISEANLTTGNSPALKNTLRLLFDSLENHFEETAPAEIAEDTEALDEITKKNVFLTIERILENSPRIRQLQDAGQLIIAPAFYRLETGTVEWL